MSDLDRVHRVPARAVGRGQNLLLRHQGASAPRGVGASVNEGNLVHMSISEYHNIMNND